MMQAPVRDPDAECKLRLPTGAALNSRIHWGKRAAQTKSDREYAAMAGRLIEAKPLVKAVVQITWHGRGRLPDLDNIAGRCKAFIDGLSDAPGWWKDDADIVWLATDRQRIAKGEEPHVYIRAWESDP
jgi:Holliday junction resolvase RusA-like endonuclease